MGNLNCRKKCGKEKTADWETIHNELNNFTNGVRHFELKVKADIHELKVHAPSIKNAIFDGLCIFAENAKELGLENALSWTVELTIFGTDHSMKYSLARFLETYEKTPTYLNQLQKSSDFKSKPVADLIAKAIKKVEKDVRHEEEHLLGKNLYDYFNTLIASHYCKSFIDTAVDNLKKDASMASNISWSEKAQFSLYGTTFLKFRIETNINCAQWTSDIEKGVATDLKA